MFGNLKESYLTSLKLEIRLHCVYGFLAAYSIWSRDAHVLLPAGDFKVKRYRTPIVLNVLYYFTG